MTVGLIAGARPNFIKAAPLLHALKKCPGVETLLIHTGQHRDPDMSAVFFEELQLPAPDVQIDCGSGSPVQQTVRIIRALEKTFGARRPDWVVVIGDITSTLAGALAAKQMGLPLAHVEAGLRSGDRRMPEELNRIATDHLADLLFASEEAGVENLAREGIAPAQVHFTGNVLIDALEAVLPKARKKNPPELLPLARRKAFEKRGAGGFALFTFHRPSNVDHAEGLARVLAVSEQVAARMPVLFPLHPRTLKCLKAFALFQKLKNTPGVFLLPPLPYSAMICLIDRATVVVTDSGGVQEESTCLNTPCLTLRSTTERPATVRYGSNTLIPQSDLSSVLSVLDRILSGGYKTARRPPLWDGQASGRIAAVLTGTNPLLLS